MLTWSMWVLLEIFSANLWVCVLRIDKGINTCFMPVFSFWNLTNGCFSPTVSNMSDQNHGCRDSFAQVICSAFLTETWLFQQKLLPEIANPKLSTKVSPSTTGFRQRRTCQTSPNGGVVCVRDAKLVKQPFFLLLHEKKTMEEMGYVFSKNGGYIWWLGDYFHFGMANFQVLYMDVSFREDFSQIMALPPSKLPPPENKASIASLIKGQVGGYIITPMVCSYKTRSWFQTFFLCSSLFGDMMNLTSIFFRGVETTN